MLIGIFGTGRNGSTLIQRLLDGLEDTYVHPIEEFFLTAFDDLARKGRVFKLTGQNCRTRPLRRLDDPLTTTVLSKYFRTNLNALYSEHIRACPATAHLPDISLKDLLPKQQYRVSELIVEYLRAIGGLVRPDLKFRHFMFKSIETPYLSDYAATFPDMRFIHIMRHPVAVCSSQKRSLIETKRLPGWYLGYDWLTCMMNKRWIPHARFLQSAMGDPKHIVVLYERLVSAPQAEIGRISQWLGLAAPA